MDPVNIDNLIIDGLDSAKGCDELQLRVNLKMISQYNYEIVKERLRAYTEGVLRTVDNNT